MVMMLLTGIWDNQNDLLVDLLSGESLLDVLRSSGEKESGGGFKGSGSHK